MTYLVTGATGTVGRAIVRRLLETGHPVRALTRDVDRARPLLPQGVEVVRGDLTAPESLVPHMDGVTGLHLVTFGGDDHAPLETGPRLVELAEAAGVRRVTVLSDFYEGGVQAALRDSRLAWTFLNPVEFMANTTAWAASIRAEGIVREPGPGPSAVVHEADIASVAVTALTQDGHGGHSLLLTGPEALTLRQRVDVLARALDREVTLVVLTPEELVASLRAQGHDEEYVAFAHALAVDPPEVGGRVQDTVERVTGRPARTFAAWVEENAHLFR
ncbi:NAD(P)H-binding protein [Nocardiopsis sp. MG754419]|uniref:NAD(P)H-binding protein n=1 Tax=Nocardiopsis sp. MG754419 TaxID=2259865 RepID=UPI001BAAD500|nr:NAD(P)H-binding protein [Nocardiopsis sp. MG754419]MBR8741019.1 hydroxylase [Nocardiopsis sp. MG754419]